MNQVQRLPLNFLMLAAGLLICGAVIAQTAPTGFKDTDLLMQEATELEAAVLAPKNYAAATKSYSTARKYAESGRMDKATKELVDVNNYLRKAVEASKIAEVTFTDTLKARDRARAAEAAKFEPALWSEAEEELVRAARKLEAGDLKGAKTSGNRAGKAYNDTELAAIKTAIVGNARVLLAEAEANPNKVERNAPITLAEARSLVKQAEASLDVNRYEREQPKALAAEAEYQARHAMYLAGQVEMLQDRRMTAEELILKWEKPLRDIAGALEVTTDMSAGYEEASTAALGRANNLVALNNEKNMLISELEVQLGDTETALQRSERLKQQFADVEGLFNSQEADLMVVNNDIVLRLTGLNFAPGRAVIEPANYELLSRVQRSLYIFNDASIVVEAHTDSQGEEDANLVLSQQRANAVRTYLVANSDIPPTRISSEGFGESRPIASNMYEEGRAENRRIDIVFKNVRSDTQAAARSAR